MINFKLFDRKEYVSHSAVWRIGIVSDCGIQCFGSVFIEPGSGQKSQSGTGYRRQLNPDPSCFLTLPGINTKLFYNYKIFPSKEVN